MRIVPMISPEKLILLKKIGKWLHIIQGTILFIGTFLSLTVKIWPNKDIGFAIQFGMFFFVYPALVIWGVLNLLIQHNFTSIIILIITIFVGYFIYNFAGPLLVNFGDLGP